MDLASNLLGIRNALALLALVLVIEAIIPLYKRNVWHRRHLLPNLGMAALAFALGTLLNVALLAGLLWLQAAHFGFFNMIPAVPPVVEIVAVLLVLDFAWYLTHRSMHLVPSFWRFHAVHHSDLVVDVTTTYRQHPVEGLIRYAFLATFAFGVGASPAAFALYRLWSVFMGQAEHANVRLPQWLDTAISYVTMSPIMHKVHHSRDRRYTDTNYSQIFSMWDRIFKTCTPARYGRDIDFGLNGCDSANDQSFVGLLTLPGRQPYLQSEHRDLPAGGAPATHT